MRCRWTTSSSAEISVCRAHGPQQQLLTQPTRPHWSYVAHNERHQQQPVAEQQQQQQPSRGHPPQPWPSQQQQHHHHYHQQQCLSMQQQRQMPARQQHRQTRLSSLSRVLHVTPTQAQAMIDAYPSLRNYNHSFLSRKLQEVSQLLQVPPQQLGPALTQAPKVLGFSLHELEKRLAALTWIQPDRQLLSQLVLSTPLLLTWSSKHLQARLNGMSNLLGLCPHSLVGLLQQHPALLPASGHLQQTLQLLQQLFALAAASEQAGFGTGVVAELQAAATANAAAATTAGHAAGSQQQPQQTAAAVTLAAARQFALAHPQLLLMPPEALQSQVAAMQATSGLPAAQVAAMLISQPKLLLAVAGG